jgi:multimeric flavodoxin WrbA
MKTKRVLVVMGSPRPKGNSTILAMEAARGAKDAGAEVETIRLAILKISPCAACDGCRKPDANGCVRKDDMTPLYDKLRAADAILIAGPVYWFSISAQVKLFMDRFYAFGAESYKPLKGKRIGIILTYADADKVVSGAANAIASFKDAFAYVKAPIVGIVHGSADKAGEVLANKTLMTKANALGRKIGA